MLNSCFLLGTVIDFFDIFGGAASGIVDGLVRSLGFHLQIRLLSKITLYHNLKIYITAVKGADLNIQNLKG